MRLQNFLTTAWVRMGIKVAREGASILLDPGYLGDTLTPFETSHTPRARNPGSSLFKSMFSPTNPV